MDSLTDAVKSLFLLEHEHIYSNMKNILKKMDKLEDEKKRGKTELLPSQGNNISSDKCYALDTR